MATCHGDCVIMALKRMGRQSLINIFIGHIDLAYKLDVVVLQDVIRSQI